MNMSSNELNNHPVHDATGVQQPPYFARSSNDVTGRKHARSSTPQPQPPAMYLQQQQLFHMQTQHLQQMQAFMAQNGMLVGDASLVAAAAAAPASSSTHSMVTGNSSMSMVNELHERFHDASELDNVEDDEDEPAESSDADDTATGAAAIDPTTGMAPSGARRVRLTLGQKREVLDLAASKRYTHLELAKLFRVGRTTITNICRQEELIRSETDAADALKKKRKTTKFAYDMRVLDECLHKWRLEVRVSSPEQKITGAVLQQKAMDFATQLLHEPFANLTDKIRLALAKFTASNGWLDGYRMRFGPFSTKAIGSSSNNNNSSDHPNVIKSVDLQTRLRELHHALRNVDVQDIWTLSELAIVTKASAAGAAVAAAAVASGGAHPSNAAAAEAAAIGKFTLALVTNAAGETFDLQVIGVDRQPLDDATVDLRATYRIDYSHSTTGCQVAHTTVAMLQRLNALANRRKRTFRVVLDSAVPHVKAAILVDAQGDHRTFFVFDRLEIYFVPPNIDVQRFHPHCRELHQRFKARFRCEMVDALAVASRQCRQRQMPFVAERYVHARNVFHWLSVALASLDRRVVQCCWVQSGLLPTQTLATLDMEEHVSVCSNASTVNSVHTTSTASSNAASRSSSNAATNTTTTSAFAAELALPATIYCDLQRTMDDAARTAPDLLHALGVTDPSSAQLFAELDDSVRVVDPAVDDVQIIRNVLQKNDCLHTQQLDDALDAAAAAAAGQVNSARSVVADEPCPSARDALAAIDVLKQFLRLSQGDAAIPNRVDAIVQLNNVRAALRSNSSIAHDG